jgi:peptidyl-prolyl cis-trans isomerase A (cyclophilin A)
MKKLLAILAALSALALASPAWSANPTVEMKTNFGAITIELYADKAPKTVENFLQYVKDGHYNGTIFHRVIDGFMIQGGGMDLGMKEKATRAPVENEAKNGLKNQIGTIAMARTSDPHSATSQFFINLVNNDPLDYPSRDGWGYCVFGKVTQGMDVVNKISKVSTGSAMGHQNVPTKPVLIESVKLIEAAKPAKPTETKTK